MSTSTSVMLTLLRYGPLDIHTSQTSRADHAGVYWALGNEFFSTCCQDRKNMGGSLRISLEKD